MTVWVLFALFFISPGGVAWINPTLHTTKAACEHAGDVALRDHGFPADYIVNCVPRKMPGEML